MATANGGLPEDSRILLRIGINLGDVMVEGSDLYGDGVNIAARLEALAEPGGIFISSTAFDYVTSKVQVGFEDLGDAEPEKYGRAGPRLSSCRHADRGEDRAQQAGQSRSSRSPSCPSST